MKKIIKLFGFTALIISSSFLLSACSKKTVVETSDSAKNTAKTAKKIELSADEKPYISLIPTSDGHTLSLKISQIPPKFTSVDYELIYTAIDGKIEIEKGVSGTIKSSEYSSTKDLLLGTASCTNGCKYKYDEGVTGGTLTLTLNTDNKEYFNHETPFVFSSGTDINKTKKINLIQDNFTINGTVTNKSEYFIIFKNFKSIYSVFSSGTGKGKIISIEPTTITKSDTNTIAGDYTITQ